MTAGCLQTAIAGRFVVAGTPPESWPVLTVRALDPAVEATLAETTSTPAGEFLLRLPVNGAVGCPLRISVAVQAVDRCGVVVGEAEVSLRPGERPALLLSLSPAALGTVSPVHPADAPPLLLVEDSVAHLRRHLASLAARGDLESGAPAALEQGLRPLVWAAALMDDARSTLSGDAEAAERLRAALLGLGVGPELPVERASATLHGEEAAPRDAEAPEALRVLHPEGLSALAAAVAWSAADRTEGQAMLNGLATVLWSAPWVELLLATAQRGAPLQSLMGGPGPGWGLPPGWKPGGLPVPGLPPGGGLPPGWGNVPTPPKKVPAKVGPIVAELVPGFEFAINHRPSRAEQCLTGALVAAARAREAAPHYEIRGLSPHTACPGSILTLTGVHFGATGTVLFPGKGEGVRATEVLLWSDTQIRVRVPPGAAPGSIRLLIFEGNLDLCGRLWPIYRLGQSLPYFNGGIPVIRSFTVEGSVTAVVAAPETDVQIAFETSAGAAVTAAITVRNMGAVVFSRSWPGGGAHSVTVRTPAANRPLDLQVVLVVGNTCGTSEQQITLTVARQPDLKIGNVEVTQAIQRLDNSVRLAGRRRTVVRVYLNPGLNAFSYTDDPNALPGVTGSVTLWRGDQKLAVVTPWTSPFTARAVFFPYAREDLSGSLNFTLPFADLTGPLRVEIRVWVESLPHGVVENTTCSDLRNLYLNFEPPRVLSLARVLVNDSWRGLPAPSMAEWQASLQGAMARFPVADDGWSIRILPGLTHITVDNDLSTKDGWDDMLEDLDDVAGDADDAWDHRWVGLLPAYRPTDTFTIRGIGRTESVDRPWPLANDYPAMAVLAGDGEIFAHELGHTLGFNHAGCPPGKPEDIDHSLPLYIEEHGLDLYTLAIFKPLEAGELMGYCKANGLWPSIVTWHRMMDRLG